MSGDRATCELQGTPALRVPFWEVCILKLLSRAPRGGGPLAWGRGLDSATQSCPGREDAVGSRSHKRKGDLSCFPEGAEEDQYSPYFTEAGDEAHGSGSLWLGSFKASV